MEENAVSTFGDFLKSFRKRRNITQQDLANRIGLHRNTIGTWERGDFLPESKTLVLELARQLHLDEQDTRRLLEASLTALSPYWHLPYMRNPFFTGRERVLARLHEALKREQRAVLSQSYALSGLGGVGKTQTAIEYAYRYGNNYTAVFWINAETGESLVSSLAVIATVLNLPEKQEHEQQKVVAAVTRWLGTHRDWLVIFDNVEEVERVKGLLSAARSGSVLLTSRKQALGFTAQTLTLEQMTQEEGMCLFLHRARLLDPTASLDSLAPTEKAMAQEIVATMDGLPLALDQAGAYIEATQCSLSDYLQMFQFSHMRLLDMRDTHADHPVSVTRTFALAFERLEQTCPPAAQLLTACAFLAPEAIPETFFREGAAYLGPTFEALAADPLQFQGAMKALLSYSLLQRQAATQTVTIHRLVQAVLKGNLSETLQRTWRGRVIRTIARLFPSEEMQADYWQRGEQLLPHARLCLTASEQEGEDEVVCVSLMNHVATYLSLRAQFHEAESFYEQAHSLGMQVLGPEHPLVADVLHAKADSLRVQGMYEQAKPLYQHALSIRKHALGEQHLLVATSLSRLADLSSEQGNYEQAEALFQQALVIGGQTSEPQIASTFNGLAILYAKQGKYEQAEPLFQHALHIWEHALGSKHSQIAYVLNNLAGLCSERGNYEQAEMFAQRALTICERTLGAEHPRVAFSLTGLAIISFEQGKYEQAEAFGQRALTICERTLGAEHPRVADLCCGLAVTYTSLGQYEQAELLFQRSIQSLEHTLGPEHPLVAQPLTGRAILWSEQGHYEQAGVWFRRALLLRQQHLGQDHPEVAETLHYFARFHQMQQQSAEALTLYQQALTIREQALGPEHPKTCVTRMAHTQLLNELERLDQTECHGVSLP